MSLFSRWFAGKNDGPAVQPEPTSAAPRACELEVLLRISQPGGPNEHSILAALQALAGTPSEASAIDAVCVAATRDSLPESVQLVCANLLAARGDRLGAIQLLQGASSVPALMLRADLLFALGDVAQATSAVEHVLARDFSTPGAQERHARWSRLLRGNACASTQPRDETIAVPTAHQSPFRILREVARGGAGVVYAAHDDLLARDAALKVYHRPREDSDQIRRETTTAVQLAGPGIIRVFDVDFAQGWIALEWIGCGSLRDIVASKRFDLLLPLRSWVHPLAEALARIHAAGFVHADIKPANILLRSPGHPVLSDFGISVRIGGQSLGGSAGYLSPERLVGKPLAPSDDVYAFGKVLQEIVAGVENDFEAQRLSRLAEDCLAATPARPRDGSAIVQRLGG